MKKTLSILFITGLALGACSQKPETDPYAQGGSIGGNIPGGVDMAGLSGGGLLGGEVADTVHFEVDRSALSATAQSILDAQASWLLRNPQVAVTIEGHADERGTREYNIGLGDARAHAVYRYLVARGVAGSRISTISYGRERPIAVCSNESCWSQNRRGVTVVARGVTG